MSYFLWIEDFEGYPKVVASNVFGGILNENHFSDDLRRLKQNLKEQGIFIETSIQDSINFIREKLHTIDYIILDIDFPAYSKGDEINHVVLKLLTNFQDYQKSEDENEDTILLQRQCDRLKEIAGFYIYTELIVELGFPKQHILFCSNHGENTTTIQNAFKSAKIQLPTIYKKADKEVNEWVKERYENPYSRLRRGIIEGCQYLRKLPEDQLRFKKFIKESEKQPGIDDIRDYLDVLANFLPLREPEKPEKTASLYKLFIRTLAHEWEAADPDQPNKSKLDDQEAKEFARELKNNGIYAFSWIMKMTRNWLAHSKVFEQLSAEDVAYLFIVNMRAMFDLGDQLLAYESHLLSLFSVSITADDMKYWAGSYHGNRKIPLIKNYAALLHKSGKRWEAVNYHDALNQFQKNKSEKSPEDMAFLITGLYQTFWFLTSNGFVSLPTDEDKNLDTKKLVGYKVLNYQFGFFDYKKSDFLLEFSRHIYSRSFLQD